MLRRKNKLNLFHENKTLDIAIELPEIGLFRINVFYQRHGYSMVFRSLPQNPPSMEQLKLPAICQVASGFPNGLVLITGPTGSGKSTTLAAIINEINIKEKKHIITLEDPIEFRHQSQKSLVNQRQLHDHFPTFASALKAALREDPDVILVGEMRDAETTGLGDHRFRNRSLSFWNPCTPTLPLKPLTVLLTPSKVPNRAKFAACCQKVYGWWFHKSSCQRQAFKAAWLFMTFW